MLINRIILNRNCGCKGTEKNALAANQYVHLIGRMVQKGIHIIQKGDVSSRMGCFYIDKTRNNRYLLPHTDATDGTDIFS